MKNTIESITVERLTDDSPDTSWLGEYSNTKDSEESIDRKHSLDCASVNSESAVNQLERIITYLNAERLHATDLYNHYGTLESSERFDSVDNALDLCVDAQDEVMACNCSGGDMCRNEFRYFNPSFNYKDETPENRRKYTLQDYERMESLNAGDWCFIGIIIKAQIVVNGISQTLRSGGLWGIESDSEKEYIASVVSDESADLRSVLSGVGFSARSINKAFKELQDGE